MPFWEVGDEISRQAVAQAIHTRRLALRAAGHQYHPLYLTPGSVGSMVADYAVAVALQTARWRLKMQGFKAPMSVGGGLGFRRPGL